MSRASSDTQEYCFYCNAPVSGNGVGDHFPIPFGCGGDYTVPCCQSCHDAKDRYGIYSWPIEWVEDVMRDFPNLNRATKLFLAKAMRIHAEKCFDGAGSAGARKKNPHPILKEMED